jgi:hypothetical protein
MDALERLAKCGFGTTEQHAGKLFNYSGITLLMHCFDWIFLYTKARFYVHQNLVSAVMQVRRYTKVVESRIGENL